MGKYSKLLISKAQVEDAINEFGNLNNSSFCFEKPRIINAATGQTRYKIKLPNNEFEIDCYFRSDNKTTIMPLGTEAGKELADYIVDSLEYSEIECGSFSINTSETTFNNLINYLSGIDGVEIVKNQDSGNEILRQFLSDIGDKVTLTYYKSTNNLHFQGKFFKLYAEVKCFLNPVVGVDNGVYIKSMDLKVDGVELLVKNSIPLAYDKIGNYYKDYLYDSFVHIKNKLKCKDYSTWTFPALKGLEAFIKKLFLVSGVILNDKNGFKLKNPNTKKLEPIFLKMNSSNSFYLNSNLVNIKDKNMETALLETYEYYNKHRHVLFHTKQLEVTTKKIKSSSDAESIVYKVCDLFQKHHNLIV